MKKLFFTISILFLFIANEIYCQSDSLKGTDKVHLKNGQILDGKVNVIKKESVDFIENSTGLRYEFQKSEIKVILLSGGKSISFEDVYEKSSETKTKKDTVVVEKDSGTSPALIILGAVGAVLIVLLLIGAAAQ